MTVIVISAAQTLWGEKETDIEDITSQVREIDQAVNTFECGYDVSLQIFTSLFTGTKLDICLQMSCSLVSYLKIGR